MKYILSLLTVGVAISISSCRQEKASDHNANVVAVDTVINNQDTKEAERLKRRAQIENQARKDSLTMVGVLHEALEIADKNIGKDTFFQDYVVAPDSIPVRVEINLDYHFTKEYPHLVIRRKEPFFVYIDIYTKKGSHFEHVLAYDRWEMEYMNDTIRDINGDGLNDFVVNWYGSTGCCLKGFSDVFLLRQEEHTFSSKFKFINPTFSPAEKIIRGVCYGHPGETEMYKYRWHGEAVDTVEFVSYERTDQSATGKVLISRERFIKDKGKILKVLNSVPAEYKGIVGYDWFIGNI